MTLTTTFTALVVVGFETIELNNIRLNPVDIFTFSHRFCLFTKAHVDCESCDTCTLYAWTQLIRSLTLGYKIVQWEELVFVTRRILKDTRQLSGNLLPTTVVGNELLTFASN